MTCSSAPFSGVYFSSAAAVGRAGRCGEIQRLIERLLIIRLDPGEDRSLERQNDPVRTEIGQRNISGHETGSGFDDEINDERRLDIVVRGTTSGVIDRDPDDIGIRRVHRGVADV